ncbi:MAG: TlpA family protein disulfide reductase [Anaerolineae bacterium]|nr:MAG: TlpA family protein disulfide reductase [Anaerolineae bacterium]
MSRNARRRRNRRKSPAPWMLAGGGLLILLGVLSALWGASQTSQADAAPKGAPSAIPVEVPARPAPEISLQGLDGQPVALSDFRGQVVLLNNWATWCPPCKAEMPDLQAYHEAHQADGFTVIAVNAGDPPDEVRAFAREYGLTFPVWPDPNTETLRAFGIQGLPTSFVIDRNGMVRATWTGAITRQALEKYVTPYLKEKN